MHVVDVCHWMYVSGYLSMSVDVYPCPALLVVQSVTQMLLPLCRQVAHRHPNLVERLIPMNCPHPRYISHVLFVLHSPLGALVCTYKPVLRVGLTL